MNTKNSYGSNTENIVSRVPVLLIFLLVSFPGYSEEEDVRTVIEQGQCVGYTISQVWNVFGPPEEIYPIRGDYEQEDNVVFYYSDHFYLFFFHNRVWQVRMDRRYQGKPLSLPLLSTRESVEEVLGPPFAELEDSLVFHLRFDGYPIRGRIFFEENRMVDVYIYRGDY
jgi:hypothetical protein